MDTSNWFISLFKKSTVSLLRLRENREKNRLVLSNISSSGLEEVKQFDDVLRSSLITYNVITAASNLIQRENSEFFMRSMGTSSESISLKNYSPLHTDLKIDVWSSSTSEEITAIARRKERIIFTIPLHSLSIRISECSRFDAKILNVTIRFFHGIELISDHRLNQKLFFTHRLSITRTTKTSSENRKTETSSHIKAPFNSQHNSEFIIPWRYFNFCTRKWLRKPHHTYSLISFAPFLHLINWSAWFSSFCHPISQRHHSPINRNAINEFKVAWSSDECNLATEFSKCTRY